MRASSRRLSGRLGTSRRFQSRPSTCKAGARPGQGRPEGRPYILLCVSERKDFIETIRGRGTERYLRSELALRARLGSPDAGGGAIHVRWSIEDRRPAENKIH